VTGHHSTFRPSRAGRALVVLLLAAALPLIGRASSDPHQGTQSTSDQQEPPRFRVEANFVRVDVYPTAKGAAVRDLTQDDFAVFEDGKPQKIESFEHVQVRGASAEEARYEPNTVQESRAIAEEGRGRLFVIFLDTYHVDYAGSHRMQRSLVNLLNRVLGPDDMYAVMTPEMSAMDISFARKTTTVEGYLSKYWTWGQRDTLYPEDPVEQDYLMCYPNTTAGYQGVAQEMIARRRERKALDALDDLSKHLRGVREERKAVITITGGWVLFRPNENLTRNGRSTLPRAGVTPAGRLTGDLNPNIYGEGASQRQCENDRLMLANLDNWQAFHDMLDDANRGNVSFYPVNALGLEALDRPLGSGTGPLEGEVQALARQGRTVDLNGAAIENRTENLQSLADNTDGLAVVNTNDVDKGMRRIVDDLTSYYLLGYYSSNGKLDGKYRKISVKVNRPGVDVRARHGYRAATEEEIERSRVASATREAATPPSAVQAALNALGTARPGIPLRTSVSYAATTDGEGHPGAHLWALAELDASVARQGEWLGGGTVEVAVLAPDRTTLASKSEPLAPGERAVAVDLGEVTPPPGEVLVRTRVSPAQDRGLPYNDTIHLGALAPPGRPLVLRRGPTTGIKFVPTADLQFHRTERVRLDLPVAVPVTSATAEVLDRAGASMPIPVRATTRTEGATSWVSAELSLAPLAAGDYLIRLKATTNGTSEEVVTGFRVVP
jgi:VWFA-related protein